MGPVEKGLAVEAETEEMAEMEDLPMLASILAQALGP